MSKLKSPREKKDASLAKDRRNVYGENDKASRKRIPKAKQEAHQNLRRSARQPLQNITTALPEDVLTNAESLTRESEIRAKRKGFRKQQDAPLASILKARRAGEPRYRAEIVLK